MNKSIECVRKTKPIWASVNSLTSSRIIVTVYPSKTIWQSSGIVLQIDYQHDPGLPNPTVKELEPGNELPEQCPDRHIQGDSTFCLGLDKINVATFQDAEKWWDLLRQYLKLQDTAEKTGIWPPQNALDHGGAGKYHKLALDIAKEIGFEEEYLNAYLDQKSWITDKFLRISDKHGNPINGRAICPCGCKKQGRPQVRRSCKHRYKIAKLVFCEKKRRELLVEYWKKIKSDGVKCCGKMRTCKLR